MKYRSKIATYARETAPENAARNNRELGILTAKGKIIEMPAADVALVKHGKWEEWWPGLSVIMTGEEMLWRCSVCDAKYPDKENMHFCPWCGAMMD